MIGQEWMEVLKMSAKGLSPFDYSNSINFSKLDIMIDDIAEKKYSPFMVNRTLSYFPDTSNMPTTRSRKKKK